jgi:hypothetical protein
MSTKDLIRRFLPYEITVVEVVVVVVVVVKVLGKGVNSAKEAGKKAEENIVKFGAFLGQKINQSGVKDKFKGLFSGGGSGGKKSDIEE